MGTRVLRGTAVWAGAGPRCALAAKLTLANRNENAEEVIFSGEEEGCQEEGHQEEGCEEEEVTIQDLARPQGIGRRPVGQSPNDSEAEAFGLAGRSDLNAMRSRLRIAAQTAKRSRETVTGGIGSGLAVFLQFAATTRLGKGGSFASWR
jgi:hypothetical protein